MFVVSKDRNKAKTVKNSQANKNSELNDVEL